MAENNKDWRNEVTVKLFDNMFGLIIGATIFTILALFIRDTLIFTTGFTMMMTVLLISLLFSYNTSIVKNRTKRKR